jgi:hypothetical protein
LACAVFGFLDVHTNNQEAFMKVIVSAAVVVFFIFSGVSAAGQKDYQVTGVVKEVRGDVIVVDKGGENWEVAKDKDTKVVGEVKVGSKVTMKYTMTAKSVEVKEEKKAEGKKTEDKPKKK